MKARFNINQEELIAQQLSIKENWFDQFSFLCQRRDNYSFVFTLRVKLH